MISQSPDLLSHHSESDLIPLTEEDLHLVCGSPDKLPEFNEGNLIDVDMQ